MKVEFTINPDWERFIKSVHGKSIKVGVPGSKLTDGGGNTTPVGKAIRHEFGSVHIPARPFIRPVMLNPRNVLNALKMAMEAKNIGLTAVMLAGQVREYLINLTPGKAWKGTVVKDISAQTKREKGSDAILFDTGAMAQSIQGVVE